MFRAFVINPPVFFGALVIIAAFLLVGLIVPGQAADIFGGLQAAILHQFGWLYLLSVGIFLVAILLFALGRFGRLKLGPDDSTPDFSYLSWVAMLFAAGMGIGLMFYAVGEPITHFMLPPTAEPGSIPAMREAMSVTFFHWGIHAWAIYAVVGLSLAYFGYRYNLPLTIRSGLYPLLKDRIDGPIGHAVDIFAIVGTMFGIATSLGLGVTQINAGLNYLLGLPMGPVAQIPLIAVITLLATISVVTGLDKGIRRLSEGNLAVAILLMLFVLVMGPTADLFRSFVQNIGLYLDHIVLRTFNIYAYQPTPWVDAWTLFYWAWWISWSPFVVRAHSSSTPLPRAGKPKRPRSSGSSGVRSKASSRPCCCWLAGWTRCNRRPLRARCRFRSSCWCWSGGCLPACAPILLNAMPRGAVCHLPAPLPGSHGSAGWR